MSMFGATGCGRQDGCQKRARQVDDPARRPMRRDLWPRESRPPKHPFTLSTHAERSACGPGLPHEFRRSTRRRGRRRRSRSRRPTARALPTWATKRQPLQHQYRPSASARHGIAAWTTAPKTPQAPRGARSAAAAARCRRSAGNAGSAQGRRCGRGQCRQCRQCSGQWLGHWRGRGRGRCRGQRRGQCRGRGQGAWAQPWARPRAVLGGPAGLTPAHARAKAPTRR